MTSKRLMLGFLGAWLIAFAGSFVAFYFTPSRDFGLAAGFNRIGVWLGWQAAAVLFACMAAVVGKEFSKGSALRRLSRMPFYSMLGLILLGVLGVFLINYSSRPPANPTAQPTRPTATEAAAPLGRSSQATSRREGKGP